MTDPLTILKQLETITSEMLGWISGMPMVSPAKDLEDKAKIIILIRRTKELLDSTKSDTNKVLDVLCEKLCREMVDKDMTELDVVADGRKYRLYPRAKGFYSHPQICTPEFNAFYKWTRENEAFTTDATKRGAKRALDALCDALLEAGSPLPPHVKAYVRPTVTVRRLEEDAKGHSEERASNEATNGSGEF